MKLFKLTAASLSEPTYHHSLEAVWQAAEEHKSPRVFQIIMKSLSPVHLACACLNGSNFEQSSIERGSSRFADCKHREVRRLALKPEHSPSAIQ